RARIPGVDDAEAAVAGRVRADRGLLPVEEQTVRANADAVPARIEARRVRARDVRGHRRLVHEAEREVAVVAGTVGVVLVHEKAVDERLQRTEADPPLVGPRSDATVDGLAPQRQREERVDANAEHAFSLKRPEEREVGRAS